MVKYRINPAMFETGSKEHGTYMRRDYSVGFNLPNPEYDEKCKPGDPDYKIKSKKTIWVVFGKHPERGEVMEADLPEYDDLERAVAEGVLLKEAEGKPDASPGRAKGV